MGVTIGNGGLRGHGTADPISATTDLWFHWGNKSLAHSTAVSDTQAVALQAAAKLSQSAFDTAANAVASWYALTSLTTTERAAARARIRAGVVKFANTPRPP